MQGSSEVRIKMTQDYASGIQVFSANTSSSVGTSGGGGSYYAGIRILWERDGGITGADWYLSNSSSPFSNASVEEIHAEIDRSGNLDTYFSAWVTNVEDEDKESFIKNTIPDGCWTMAWSEQ